VNVALDARQTWQQSCDSHFPFASENNTVPVVFLLLNHMNELRNEKRTATLRPLRSTNVVWRDFVTQIAAKMVRVKRTITRETDEHDFLTDDELLDGHQLQSKFVNTNISIDVHHSRSTSVLQPALQSNTNTTTTSSNTSARLCCDLCGLHFSNVVRFESHANYVHKCKCSECWRRYPSIRLLELHVIECHDSMFKVMSQKQNMVQTDEERMRFRPSSHSSLNTVFFFSLSLFSIDVLY
jgi:hypothetical protein